MKKFTELAINNVDELIFGNCPKPVNCKSGLIIGGGLVYPEINFTLPPISIDNKTWFDVVSHYTQIIENVCERSKKLNVPGLVVEFEQLPPMTMNPEWGGEITRLLARRLEAFQSDTGIKTALRVTVVDLRDADRPPLLRQGNSWEKTKEAFICAAQAGADILSIESIGGKEVHDQALVYGDIQAIVTSLGSLAYRDMAWLWKEITKIADEYNCISGGDTACGFSNTAMQLAGKGMLPHIVAALDRAASAPRSLAAFENGAIGPSKDCAYEGPIIKAITGCPISMEGKSSCCAHFSPLGNIAAAAADLWSNESVQNVRLLSGNAPEAFMELLAYDCRLLNTASKKDQALILRDQLVESDNSMNVEALILDPSIVIQIAKSIVKEDGGYKQTVAAVKTAFDAVKNAVSNKRVNLAPSEINWIGRLESEIDLMPETEIEALENLQCNYGYLFEKSAYGLE
jgi:methanol--5-hydroxybenzimidazolylcobamide Co-methyltransferase